MHVTTGIRVGELARRTGISVRTLHYYEEIGLLAPARQAESGYRRYAEGDIARLQQIVSLRQIGLSLDEIRAVLTEGDCAPEHIIALHIARLEEQIVRAQDLRARLDAVERSLRVMGTVSVDELIKVIEVTQMYGKYYTPEQLEWLKQRREALGEEHIRAVEAEWPQLIAKVRDAMDAGIAPSDPQVQALARRWSELVAEFTGGNPGIEQSVRKMYRNEQPQDIHPSLDPRMGEYGDYIAKARAAGKS